MDARGLIPSSRFFVSLFLLVSLTACMRIRTVLDTGALSLISTGLNITALTRLTAGDPILLSDGQGGQSANASYSADGAYIVFDSESDNFVPWDTNGAKDVFIRNVDSGEVTRVSENVAGETGNDNSKNGHFSADGTQVIFESSASNLIAGDTNGSSDIFIKTLSTGVVTRVSLSSAGLESDGESYNASFSADGTKIVFQSQATNLVAGDTNGSGDIFVKTLATGVVIRVSTTSADAEVNDESTNPVFSPDGTKVAFQSVANDLVVGDTNGVSDIFIKDIGTSVVTRVSTNAAGFEINSDSINVQFSVDGTMVVFESDASDMIAGDTNFTADIFIKNLIDDSVQRVSEDSIGGESDGWSSFAQFSPDGTKVLFYSDATNLVAGDTNGTNDVYVKVIGTGALTRVSTDDSNFEGNSDSMNAQFSPDGNSIVFQSYASNLVLKDTNGALDIFTKNLSTDAVVRVSSNPTKDGNYDSWNGVFSSDGTKIVFVSEASNLVAGDTNGVPDIFVKDLITGVITRVSTDENDVQGDGQSHDPAFSPDGTKVVFESDATNLVPGDMNGVRDIFIKDLVSEVVTRVSTDSMGAESDNISYHASFSPDGTQVVFGTDSTNLVAGDTNAAFDIFVKTIDSGAIVRISTDAMNGESDLGSFRPLFSPDGTKVLFRSNATNLVPGDTNGAPDLFVKTLGTGAIMRVATDSFGVESNAWSGDGRFSPDSNLVVFESLGTNLVAGDTNGSADIFIKNLTTGEIERVSTDALGAEGSTMSYGSSFSPDGTKVIFSSDSPNLVPGDSGSGVDIFIKTIATGAIIRIPFETFGTEGSSYSSVTSFSADGQYILFDSIASHLDANDSNAARDVYIMPTP